MTLRCSRWEARSVEVLKVGGKKGREQFTRLFDF